MRIPVNDAHKAYLQELLPASSLAPESEEPFAEETLLDRANGLLHQAWKNLLPIVAAIMAFLSSSQAAMVDIVDRETLQPGPGWVVAQPLPDRPRPSPGTDRPFACLPRGSWADADRRARKRWSDPRSPDLGIATHTGKVRSRNEDAGAALDLEEVRVALLADGLGGEPFGDVASLCAIEAAASALAGLDGFELADDTARAEQQLRVAFAAAEAALAEQAGELGIKPGRSGLRTTLLIAIASHDRIVFGQIGDGAMVVLREGQVVPLITAQKADPERLSLLAACLGPSTLGEPVFGVFDRRPGDVLIAATDGVSDRVTDAFYARTAAEQIAARGGDLERAAADILESLASYRHGGEIVFDDNMTLALIADVAAPDGDPLPRGFHTEESAR
jgi:protein phosphatase